MTRRHPVVSRLASGGHGFLGVSGTRIVETQHDRLPWQCGAGGEVCEVPVGTDRAELSEVALRLDAADNR
jgi:hypothetical protein